MRTIGIALYLSVFGFGNFLGALPFSADPRQEHLDKYYWFLAFVSAVSFVFFTYLEAMQLSTIP
jgi:peptide/histidine transporter 3/4